MTEKVLSSAFRQILIMIILLWLARVFGSNVSIYFTVVCATAIDLLIYFIKKQTKH